MFKTVARYLSVFLVCAPLAHSQPSSLGSRATIRLRSTIEANLDVVLFFAHPSGTLDGTTYLGSHDLEDGCLTGYDFAWLAPDGDRESTRMWFIGDTEGRLDFIYPDHTTADFAPFVGASFMLEAVKLVLSSDAEIAATVEFQRLRKLNARELLESYLAAGENASSVLVATVSSLVAGLLP